MEFLTGMITGNWKALAAFASPLVYKGLNMGATAAGADVSQADLTGTTAFVMALFAAGITWLSPSNKAKAADAG